MKINPNWKSRKWFVALITMGYGVLIHIFPSIAEHAPEDQVKQVVTILISWIIAEGTADVVSRAKKKTQNETEK